MSEPRLDHPYLARPITRLQFVELESEAALFFHENVHVEHEYVPNEAASDPFVKRLRKQHQKGRKTK